MPTASDLNRNCLIVTLNHATRWLIAGCLVLVSTGFSASSAQAAEDHTAAVAGRVLDPLGGAIANAKVTLLRDGEPVTDASCDASGHFALTATDAGRYRVHVEAQGFASKDTDPVFVAVGEQVALDVTLAIGPLVQQVIVTAAATALPESQVGASVTVLDQGVLQSLGKPDVLEDLRLVPGVQVLQTGQRGGTTSLFVRGGNDDFNKVLIDGIPANDIGGSFDFGSLPVTGIDRVEVLRNPNSVLYGADALTSVINLTTRRGMSTVPELSYAIDRGTFGTLHQDLSIGGAHQRLDYFASYSHFDTRNNVPNDADHNGTFAGDPFRLEDRSFDPARGDGSRDRRGPGCPERVRLLRHRGRFVANQSQYLRGSRAADTDDGAVGADGAVHVDGSAVSLHHPLANGRAVRPVWVRPELPRQHRHDLRRERHQRHRAGDSGFRESTYPQAFDSTPRPGRRSRRRRTTASRGA